jgi:hypothetical protein
MFALYPDNRCLLLPVLLLVFPGSWLLMAEQIESTFKPPVL